MPPRVKKLAEEIGAHVITKGPQAWTTHVSYVVALVMAFLAWYASYNHNLGADEKEFGAMRQSIADMHADIREIRQRFDNCRNCK